MALFSPQHRLRSSVTPATGHVKLVTWAKRTDLFMNIHIFKPHENPLNSSNFEHFKPKSAPTGYRFYSNLIVQYYKQIYKVELILTIASPNQISINLLVPS